MSYIEVVLASGKVELHEKTTNTFTIDKKNNIKVTSIFNNKVVRIYNGSMWVSVGIVSNPVECQITSVCSL